MLKKKLSCWLLVLSLITLFLVGCKKEEDLAEEVIVEDLLVEDEGEEEVLELTRGEIIDGVYTNSYFGIDLVLPSAWVVLSEEELTSIFQRGEGILNQENADLSGDLEDLEVLGLMGILKYPLSEEVVVNPSMIINVEKLMGEAADMDGETYLEQSKQLLADTGLPYSFKEVGELNLNNQIYSMSYATIETGNGLIGQTYCASNVNGYIVNIILTYGIEDGNEALHQILGLPRVSFD